MATVLKGGGYRAGAFVGAFVLDARFGLARGFDPYDDRYPEPGAGESFRFAERRAEAVVDAAGGWILGADASSPWFAWVHLFDAHAPYDAPAEYQQGRTPYDAEVAYADAMLGRLLDRLRRANVFDRTLIVITADHGESLGDHGELTHGLFAYDSTLAVPLIVHGPGIGHGLVEAPVGHADILPTVCDLLGVAVPAVVDGQSLVHPPDAERAVYFEALDASLTRGWAPLSGVATGRWKFIALPTPELYDLATDPNESHNLADRESARREALARTRTQWPRARLRRREQAGARSGPGRRAALAIAGLRCRPDSIRGHRLDDARFNPKPTIPSASSGSTNGSMRRSRPSMPAAMPRRSRPFARCSMNGLTSSRRAPAQPRFCCPPVGPAKRSIFCVPRQPPKWPRQTCWQNSAQRSARPVIRLARPPPSSAPWPPATRTPSSQRSRRRVRTSGAC